MYIYIDMYICMYVCMYISVSTYLSIYLYIYIYIYRSAPRSPSGTRLHMWRCNRLNYTVCLPCIALRHSPAHTSVRHLCHYMIWDTSVIMPAGPARRQCRRRSATPLSLCDMRHLCYALRHSPAHPSLRCSETHATHVSPTHVAAFWQRQRSGSERKGFRV